MTAKYRPILLALALACLPWAASAAATEVPTPESVVQAQLDAYNARDMEAFLATYADDAELYAFPGTLQTKGKMEMRKRYAVRFSDSLLHAVIAKHIVMGNTIIDHERIQVTLPEGPGVLEAILIYEVQDGKIAKVTIIYGPKTVGTKP